MNISMSKKMTAQSKIICNYGNTLMMWMQRKCKITPNLILVVNEVKQFFKSSDVEYKKLKHHICVYSHTYVSSLTAGQECFMPKPEPPPWALPGSSVQNGHIHLHKTTKHTGDHLPCHKTTGGKVEGPPSLKGIKKIHIWFFLLLSSHFFH